MSTSTNIKNKIENAFREVQAKHMQDIPVINPKLSVKALGFSNEDDFNDYRLGILITPWFMNLMLLPKTPLAEGIPEFGNIQKHTFPSGTYEFVTGFDDAFGHYQSCSLFSPMFEFDSQQAAEVTAETALATVMNDKIRDIEAEGRSREIEQIWNGEKQKPADTKGFSSQNQTKPTPERKLLSERMKAPTSRRDFLRGKLFRSPDADT